MADAPDQINARAEVIGSFTGEATKSILLLHGIDPHSAAIIGALATSTAKALDSFYVKLRERRFERLAEAVQTISDVSEGNLDEVVEYALEDDRKLELLGRALEECQRTAELQRVHLYARIAAEGVLSKDSAKVDEKGRVFSSIAALDPVDLKVLLHMSNGDKWKKRAQGEKFRAISAELPEVDPVLDAVFARLQTLGLAGGNSSEELLWGGEVWQVTPFGRLCIDELMHGVSGKVDE